MIRAKFRCMQTWATWDGCHGAEFRPVYAKKDGQDSENFEENKLFWKFTPSGEAELKYRGPHDFKAGDYFYIDMEPAEKGEWNLQEVRHFGDGSNSGEVTLYRSWSCEPGLMTGSLKMTIQLESTLALFGWAGSKWSVVFSFAAPSDG